jgi:hypothetical protein
MRVLVACEFSGVVRRAFRKAGHAAWSCDLLPAEDQSEFHIVGDCESVLKDGWDLMIAHPPCTYLCNSGVRWLYDNRHRGRYEKMCEAAWMFRRLLECEFIQRIAAENPIMHKHSFEIVGRRQDQLIQPWQFGHGETKATGLWLKNLPKLTPTEIVGGREQRVHKMPPGPERWKERSRTFEGIATAMAQQWGAINDIRGGR